MNIKLFNIFVTFIFVLFFYDQKIYGQQFRKIDEKKIVEDQVRELVVEDTFTQGGVNYTLYKDIVARYGKDNLNQEDALNKNNKQKFYNSESTGFYTNKILLEKGMFRIYHKQIDINRVTENHPPVNPHVNHPPVNPHVNHPPVNPHVNHPPVNPHVNHPPVNPHVNHPPVNPHVRPQARIIRTTEYKTAYNNSSRKFGVLTGNIVIRINPYERLPALEPSYKIVKEYQHMGLYLVNIPKNIKIGKALQDLRKKIQKVDGIGSDFSASVNVEVLENFKKNR